MSSRFENRSSKSFNSGHSSGKSSRAGRTGPSRRDRGGPASRRREFEQSSERERGGYRFSRNSQQNEDSSGESRRGGGDQRRPNRERREQNRFDDESSLSSNRRSGRFNKQGKPRRISDRSSVINTGWRPKSLQQRNLTTSSIKENIDELVPEQGVFSEELPKDLIWGRHAAQAALESGRPLHRVWCTPELRSSPRFLQLLRDAKSSGVLVEEVTWARIGQLTSGAVHQGIVLQSAAAETLDLNSLIQGCLKLGESPLLLALDGLTDPQNLGAIVRSAEALGAHGLVLPQRRSAGLTGSVAKVAAGALEHLPVARVVNLNRSLEELKGVGYRVVGLAEEGDLTLPEVELDGPLVVVIGSEAKGISLVTRRHCDQLVRIPLRGMTPSLNASVASAICLYELARRGWMKGLSGQAPSPRMVRAKCPSPIDSSNKLKTSEETKSGCEFSKEQSKVSSSNDFNRPNSLNDSSSALCIDLDEKGSNDSFDQSIQL